MVYHIVMWNFIDSMTKEEKKSAASRIKEELMAVKEQVKGSISIEVIISPLSSSNKEIALMSSFENEEALKHYQEHPAHLKAADFIRKVTCERACIDYEI